MTIEDIANNVQKEYGNKKEEDKKDNEDKKK